MTNLTWKYGNQLNKSFDFGEIENSMKLKLPDDFKQCVLSHNGARPTPNAIKMQSGEIFVINRLLPADLESKNNIVNIARNLNSEGTIQLVPFGVDSFGNYFCFSYEGTVLNSVVFYEHESSSLPVRICDNFTEFLENLIPVNVHLKGEDAMIFSKRIEGIETQVYYGIDYSKQLVSFL